MTSNTSLHSWLKEVANKEGRTIPKQVEKLLEYARACRAKGINPYA
jgi:hypothetical protein